MKTLDDDDARHGAGLGAWLVRQARAEGFDDAAVVRADVALPDAPRLVDAIEHGRLAPFAWMERTLPQRVDVRARIASARSVLVVVQSYYRGDHDTCAPDAPDDAAKVARYAWGQDYHHVLRRRLRRLRKALLARVGAATDPAHPIVVAPFNDVDAVYERAWAKAAGLGFTGKSSMFIHPRLGTWTFLGGLVTTIDLTSGAADPVAMTQQCGSCTACLDACPTRAIVAPGVVDARRCVSTWTIESPTDPAGDALVKDTGWAVGCDVCQEVCPWNRFESVTTEPAFAPRHVVLSPSAPPVDVSGTPLARPGAEHLVQLARRAGPASLQRRRRVISRAETPTKIPPPP